MMKSTYRLLSIYLDRTPLPVNPPIIVDMSKLDPIQDISQEYNLFDLKCYQRRASGSVLLSYTGGPAVANILDQQPWCERIYVVLDYWSRASVATMLYMRRVMQLVRILQEQYPQIEFMLAAEPGLCVGYQQMVYQAYAMDD